MTGGQQSCWVRVVARALVLVLPMVAAAEERPNVIILLADDLGSRDIGCYGGPVRTPVLDGLASAGVRFESFYSGAPVCSPARAVLLTGRQHLRTGVYTVIQDHLHEMHLLRREVTIAEHLKSNGYQTVHVGKWHLGTPFRGRRKPWIDEHGFDYWFATDLNAAPSHLNPRNFWRNRERVGDTEGYACQLVVDEAITWLDRKRDADKPFFLNVWFHEPHAPLAAPPDIVSRYGEPNDPAAVYSATIENTDRAVGRLLEKLRKIGQLDNTIIFYTSDHGSYRPERNGDLKGNKGSLFEGGLRTPGIFCWPRGITGGRTEATPAGAVDLLPTLCGLVGLDPPADVDLDGTDLSRLLTEESKLRRTRPLFWVLPTSQPVTVVRDGRYVLVGHRGSEFPKDQPRIAQVMSRMETILAEELNPPNALTRQQLWHHAWNYECQRDDWKRLRGEFVTLNTFQESWCSLIRSGVGGPRRFELYDLSRDAAQKQNVANRYPVQFARLRKRALALHSEVVGEAVDWTDPRSVADAERPRTVEERMRVHRLKSTHRSIYDAFTYVNRIPEGPTSAESPQDFAARVFSRLANQEGRILLKAPPGMSKQAYAGYRVFLRYEGSAAGNCAACHTPRRFTDGKAHVVAERGRAVPTPSLRNLGKADADVRQILIEKRRVARRKRAGDAPGVSAACSRTRLSDEATECLVSFLKLLQDVPDDQFRRLILEARVMDVTRP